MILKAFSVKDTKAGSYSAPYFAPSIGEGERVFLKLARDPQTNVNQFAEDYDLYLVGDYDDQTTHYAALQIPQQLLKGIAAKTNQ